MGGDDVILGPTVANTGLAGGAGADYIVTRSSTGTFAFGGEGSDTIESTAFESLLFGDAGNDTFCLRPNAFHVSGGDGSDQMCGTASSFDTVESANPGDCNALCSIILE